MAKGLYTPQHPEKYLGDPRKIRFLSSWELSFMNFCDTNPNVIAWGSEEFRVKYFNPVKNKVCDYIPDFIVKYKDAQGNIITEVIEIKPLKEAVQKPKMSAYDKVALVINHAKWTAAKAMCDAAGIRFRVLTEQEMFRQKPQPAPKKGKK
jgi:hypothetical protein